MKKILTKFVLLTGAISTVFSISGASFDVTVNEALTSVKQMTVDSEADYYLVENENTLAWSIFADPTPNAGWTHKCYLFSVPKEIEINDSGAIDISENINCEVRNYPPADKMHALEIN